MDRQGRRGHVGENIAATCLMEDERKIYDMDEFLRNNASSMRNLKQYLDRLSKNTPVGKEEHADRKAENPKEDDGQGRGS